MKHNEIKFPPRPHVIESIRNTSITYAEALGELIDNSFDAGATNVAVVLQPDAVQITDDGIGCGDLSAMLALGDHRLHEETRLGRYGVGGKNAAIGLGVLLQIKSVHQGIERMVKVDWRIIDQNWTASETERETDDNSGTEIRISQLLKRRIKDFDNLQGELAFKFHPAIASGRTITIAHSGEVHKLIATPLPLFEESIIEQRYLNGISFRVVAGIIAPGQPLNQRNPFIITYGHRVLFDTAEPCFEMLASQRFVAWVELEGQWPLLKHKDGLSDKDDWLYDELYDICAPLLQKVHAEGESLELAHVAAELTEQFGILIGREKRNPGEESGSITPMETPVKRKTAEDVHANQGDCERRNSGRSRHGIIINFAALGDLIGKVDETRKRIHIQLNQDHPAVASWRQQRPDRSMLKLLAVALLASYKSHSDDQRLLQFQGRTEHDTFVNFIGCWYEQLAKRDKIGVAA